MRYQLSVQGRDREWAFTVVGSPHDALAWKLDGLDVAQIEHEIPASVNEKGRARLWCWLERVLGE